MQQGKPSETALRAARCRARHQVLDNPRVLNDPLALKILGDEADLIAQPGSEGRLARAFRGGVVARSRLVEDALTEAALQGVRQYVILGAGLDTYAYRDDIRAALRVFEVDHPDTQAWKRRLLDEAGIPVPGSVAYVPVDFQRQDLGAELAAAGFDHLQPAFFSWLGVVWYLEREAVERTLRYVGSGPKGTTVMFDCWNRPAPLNLPGRLALRMISRRYARIGEPWITFMEPARLESQMRDCGFSEVETLSATQVNQRLFARDNAHLRLGGGPLYGMVKARV